MELRTSVIKAKQVVKKMPVELRPDQNDLYSFFDGKKDRLNKEQIKLMCRIANEGTKEFVDYLKSKS